MNKYHYWAFDLLIDSEIEFPELLPVDFVSSPDLTISLGITPGNLVSSDTEYTPLVSLNPNEYLLKFPNVANYYAVNGNSIIVELLNSSDERSMRLFLLNSVISAVLYQRNCLMLDASAIVTGNGITLFCGLANSGKTTLAKAMQKRGYTFFSDEACLIRPTDAGTIESVPSYPTYRLWQDGFIKLGINLPDESLMVRSGLGKYNIFFHKDFDKKALPVKLAFILKRNTQKNAITIDKLSPVDAFTDIHNNIFCQSQIYPMKKQALCFSMVSKFANTIPVLKINWSEGENNIDKLTILAEQNLLPNE